MLDFTSALYLGLLHGSATLGSWDALSLGRPAVLASPPGADVVAEQLAQLQGLEAAVLLPSTLHLFRDLFAVLNRGSTIVLVDECVYPIERWGAEHGARRAMGPISFAHHDAQALAHAAEHWGKSGRRPIVLADGYCPGCGSVAPLPEYADIVARHGGSLVLDDTQALGILGASPRDVAAYGAGGGGSLRWRGVHSPHVIVGASLAKGFGAPLAVLSGSAALVKRFRDESDSLVHCSPPSVAVIRAAEHALAINRRCGEALRTKLSELVRCLRAWAMRAGLRPVARLPFPMQSFHAASEGGAAVLHKRLLRAGVRTVITRACDDLASRLTFLVTVHHRLAEVDLAGRLLTEAARGVAAAHSDA
jgi:8-amino-7-oxononanoate synthase